MPDFGPITTATTGVSQDVSHFSWCSAIRKLGAIRGRGPVNGPAAVPPTAPDITALVMTYNHEDYIAAALDSVASQRTSRTVEVVIADDSSTDATRRIVEEWIVAHPHVAARVLVAEPQLGITANYWRGFSAVRGRYVAILEGDDLWIADDKLERQADALDAEPGLAMAANRVLLYDTDAGDAVVVPEIGFNDLATRLTSEELAEQNWFATFSGCMYRTAHIRALPLELFEAASFDWAVNLGVTAHGDAVFLPQTMTLYRQHSSSQWSSRTEIAKLEHIHDLIPDYLAIFGSRLAAPLTRQLHAVEAELLRLRSVVRSEHEPAVVDPPAVGMPIPWSVGAPPRVSVLLTSYNNGEYLIEAANSVLDQTMSDFELIVVDDASRDDSWGLLATLTDPRIRRYRMPMNQGGAAALNYAVQESRSEFIAVLNSDDIWERHKLARQLEIIDARPELGAVFSGARYIGQTGRSLPIEDILPSSGVFRQPNRTQGGWLRFFFENGNALCHPSALVRRAFYAEAGLYDNRLRQIPDLDRWIELVKRYPIHVLGDEDLVRFRILPHGGNTSSLSEATVSRNYREHLQIMRHFFHGCPDELVFEAFGDMLRDAHWDSPAARESELTLLWLDSSGPMSAINRINGVRELHERLGDPAHARYLLQRYGIRDVDLHMYTGLLSNYPDPMLGRWVEANSPQALSALVATNTVSSALLAVLLGRVQNTSVRRWPARALHHMRSWRKDQA